jgi:hypothetical protein
MKNILILLFLTISCSLYAQDTAVYKESPRTLAALQQVEVTRKFDRYTYVKDCVSYKLVSKQSYVVSYDLDPEGEFVVYAIYKITLYKNLFGQARGRIHRKAIVVAFLGRNLGVIYSSSLKDGVLDEKEMNGGRSEFEKVDSGEGVSL